MSVRARRDKPNVIGYIGLPYKGSTHVDDELDSRPGAWVNVENMHDESFAGVLRNIYPGTDVLGHMLKYLDTHSNIHGSFSEYVMVCSCP